jgi:hypothetical protein
MLPYAAPTLTTPAPPRLNHPGMPPFLFRPKFIRPQMKKRLLQFVSCFALALNLAQAGEVNLKPVSEQTQFTYFDSSESIADFKMRMEQVSGWRGMYVSAYKIPAPTDGARTSTLCVMPFVIDRVEKSFLSSKKTLYYNRMVLNASKLRAVRPLKPEEFAKLGLAADDQTVVRRIDLAGGVSLYAVGPNDSKYAFCGSDASGTPYVAEHFTPAAEYYQGRFNESGELEHCFAELKPVYQTLPESKEDYAFHNGDEADTTLGQCRAMKAAQDRRSEEYAAKQANIRRENEEQFDREKKAHKMISGVQILGNIGASRGRQLIHRCLSFNPMVDKGLSREERKQGKCQGYYTEEVEDLQRELRLRGLDEG